MAINSNTIMVFRNGTLIAGTRSNEAQTSCGTKDVASPTNGDWEHNLAGRKSWQITTSFLLGAVADLSEMLNVGTTYTLRFGPRSSGGLTGSAILTEARVDASWGSLVKGSFKFKGTGPLT